MAAYIVLLHGGVKGTYGTVEHTETVEVPDCAVFSVKGMRARVAATYVRDHLVPYFDLLHDYAYMNIKRVGKCQSTYTYMRASIISSTQQFPPPVTPIGYFDEI